MSNDVIRYTYYKDKLDAVKKYGYNSIEDFIRIEYPLNGLQYCSKILMMTNIWVSAIVRKLGIKINGVNKFSYKRRTALRFLSDRPCIHNDHVINNKTERYVKSNRCCLCEKNRWRESNDRKRKSI